MKYIITFVLLLFTLSIFSQTSDLNKDEKKENDVKKSIAGKYKSVILGMTRDEVLESLKRDRELEIDLDTDYGDFDEEQKYIIKAKRPPFINHIYYQFAKSNDKENKEQKWVLYAIIIQFNVRYNDYANLYEKFLSKYGEADIRTSKYALWKPAKRKTFQAKNGAAIPVRLIINHPSTVKIINDAIYQKKDVEDKKTPKEAVKSYQNELNKKLLDGFFSDETNEKKESLDHE